MTTTRLPRRIPPVALGLLLAAGPAAAGVELRQAPTRALVALVREAAVAVTGRGLEAACADFRQAGSHWLEDDRYVFVLSEEGEALCHPTRPELEGRSLRELRDPKGHPIVAGFLREVADDGEGWMHYLWPRPGSTTFTWKSTFVVRTEASDGTGYVVGSGLYEAPMERAFLVEQVDDAVAILEAEGEDAFATLRDESSGFFFYDSYVFVLDGDGVLLVNEPFPENEGRHLFDLQDIDGRYFVREMIRIPVGESRWITYKWPRPGDARPSEKSSYVRAIPWGDSKLIVGAGMYFEPEPAVRELGPKPDVEG